MWSKASALDICNATLSRSRAWRIVWYRKAANQGHAAAQYNLAVRFATGTGVTQDETQAVAW
jgi:hypothetical protein